MKRIFYYLCSILKQQQTILSMTLWTSTELFQLALPSAPKIDWYALEEPWTQQKNPYSSKPEGDLMDIAKEVIHFIK